MNKTKYFIFLDPEQIVLEKKIKTDIGFNHSILDYFRLSFVKNYFFFFLTLLSDQSALNRHTSSQTIYFCWTLLYEKENIFLFFILEIIAILKTNFDEYIGKKDKKLASLHIKYNEKKIFFLHVTALLLFLFFVL
jgi:hypothetical protein